MARRAPTSDSKVRSISSSRHCTSTWIVDVVGDQLLVDDQALEVEVGLRGRREADLDLLEADRRPASGTAPACAPESMGSIRAWLPSRRSTLAQRGARVNWRSGQVRSGRTRGTCERYLSNGMGDGSQGRARRPRSMSSPLPFCPSAMSVSLLSSSSACPAPAQQKTSWPFGAGGCERTRCGVRRQVSSRLGRGALLHVGRNCPIGRAHRQGRRRRRAETQQVPVTVGVGRLPHAEPGIEQVGRLPHSRRPPLRVQSASASSTADVGRAPLGPPDRGPGSSRKWIRTPSRAAVP